jgi:hypothetical protein
MHRLPTIAAKLTSASMLPMGRETGRMKKCLKTAAALAALAAVFCILLAGCGEQQQLKLTGTPTPSVTMLAPTLTSRITRTAGPTRTRPPTLITSPTSIYPTWEPQATWTAAVIDVHDWPAQPNCAHPSQAWKSAVSPDGQWLAYHECYDPDPTLVVLNKTGSKVWNLHYLDYTNHPEDGLISLETWSSDSRYAYFYTSGYFDPIGCYYNNGGFGLFRLDVQTGETATILPLRPDGYAYIWSFSSTGRMLLYQSIGSSLQFLDLKTGATTQLQPLPDHTDFGGFRWSPDGLSVAFTLMKQAPDGAGTYYLNLIDVNSASLRTLMTSQPDQCLAASFWLNENSLVVYSVFISSDDTGTEYEVNIP